MGAACRAMKTMGFGSLALASCPEYPEEPVRTFALHAYDVYSSASRYPDLGAALSDCSLAAGFSRRTGRKRAPNPLDVEEFSRLALERRGPVAMVFGNERDGLSREELALCDVVVRIPTSDAFPSLNLSQAVQIACWELSRTARSCGPSAESGRDGPSDADRVRLEEVVDSMADDLAHIGFFKIAGRPDFQRFFRSLLARSAASVEELEYLRSIFRKASALSERTAPAVLTPDPLEARVFDKVHPIDIPEGDKSCGD